MSEQKTPWIDLASFRSAVAFAKDGSPLVDSHIHGDIHWRGVAQQGLLVSDLCGFGREGRATAVLFGLFHDCRRQYESDDPEHGPLGAEAFRRWALGACLPPKVFHAVAASIKAHEHGETTTRKLVGIGWDADRSLLTRCGLQPDPGYFSCVDADGFDTIVRTSFDAAKDPPGWPQIWSAAFAD